MRRVYRRFRHGSPVVLVSGLPRSGTSMMMKMLEAGGVPIVADHIRQPDVSNPEGYRELERVKDLAKGGDPSWLLDARGHAVKIIAYFLPYLPQNMNYRVIFMQRDLDEVLASQIKMLESRGETSDSDDDRMRALFVEHLERARELLSERSCFEVLEVGYGEAIDDPSAVATRVAGFVGGELNVEGMAASVNPDLYRSRVDEDLPGGEPTEP